MKARTLVLAAFMLLSPALSAQATGAAPALPRTGFLDETITVAGTEHRYVVYVPHDYTKERRWPLIVFLNGAGECGTDGKKQISVGLAPAMRSAAWPFIVVFPQKPDRGSQWEDHDAMVMAMLARAEKDYSIDEKQRFLTGLSQGGHGTWVLGARHADVWAAIAPVCGYGDPREIAPALKNMPIWAFHGEDDKAVPVKQSKDLCAAVEKAGGRAELTLYPGVGHNSWDNAYGKEEPLAAWLLAAATHREYASHLAQIGRSSRATLTIAREWTTDVASKERPYPAGTTTTKLASGPEGLTWQVTTAFSSGPAEESKQGALGASEARQFVLDRLRELQYAGVFDLPEVIEPARPEGIVLATSAYTIELSLEGKAGKWVFRRVLPPDAQWDPKFELQVRAIGSVASSVAKPR